MISIFMTDRYGKREEDISKWGDDFGEMKVILTFWVYTWRNVSLMVWTLLIAFIIHVIDLENGRTNRNRTVGRIFFL